MLACCLVHPTLKGRSRAEAFPKQDLPRVFKPHSAPPAEHRKAQEEGAQRQREDLGGLTSHGSAKGRRIPPRRLPEAHESKV